MKTELMFSSSTDEWESPSFLYKRANEIFHFTVDLAASPYNYLHSRYYSNADSALDKDWSGEIGWLNPPYSRKLQRQFIEKAYQHKDSAITVLLLPARPDTKNWQDFVFKANQILFLRGRLHFSGHKDAAPFPSALVLFGGNNSYKSLYSLSDLGRVIIP